MNQQEYEYYQSGLLPMAKPKPRLGSFRKFYTRSLETPSNFSHCPPAKPKTMIDDFLIEKIQKLAPSKLGKEFKKRNSRSQKIKNEKNEIGEFSITKHKLMIEKFRNRSLELSKQAALAEYRVKKQVKKNMKKINPFDASDVAWAEQRWGSKQKYQKLGKHSQKLHPICLIYEQTAEKVEHFGKHCVNPFEGFNHIQFS